MTLQLVRKLQAALFPGESVSSLDRHYQPNLYQETVCLLPYQDTAVQTAIKQNKYQRDPEASLELGRQLDRYLDRLPSEQVTIIPIPQSYTRWRERGFDHVMEIIKNSQHSSHVRQDILRKTIHTKRQAHVDRTVRLQQQAGTYTCQPAAAVTLTETVVLLDDVTTTGATMRAARAALISYLPRNTRLICLALAH